MNKMRRRLPLRPLPPSLQYARDFVDAAATYVSREDLLSELEHNAFVKFSGHDESPVVELSVVIPTMTCVPSY